MKISKKAKNVFESTRFYYLFCKCMCLLFITIGQDASGKYYAVTTKFDKIRLIFGILVGIWNFYIYLGINVNSSRAIIFEIGMNACTKWQITSPFLIMIGTYFYRFEYFEAIKNLNWIDRKVKLVLKKYLGIVLI